MIRRFHGYSFALILAVAAMAVYLASGAIPGGEGRRTNSVLLNGDWEYGIGDGDERAETPEGADRLKWQAVS